MHELRRREEDNLGFWLDIWKDGKGILIPTVLSILFWAFTLSGIPKQVCALSENLDRISTDNQKEHTEFKVFIAKTDQKYENIMQVLNRLEKRQR